MPKALKVTEETLPFIISFADERQFNLRYAHDDMIYAADFGATVYVITDKPDELDHVTFTTMWEQDFRRIWKFETTEDPHEFTEVIHL